MSSSATDGSLRLTPEELLALAQLVGVPTYPGLVLDSDDPAQIEAAASAGARSLVARGLVTVSREPEPAVAPAPELQPAIAPLIPPVAGVVTERVAGGGVAVETWWLEPQNVVRQTGDDMGVCTFTVLTPDAAHDALREAFAVEDAPAVEGEPFDARWSDVTAALAFLAGEAATSGDARLREFAADAVSLNRIDLIWQPEDGPQEISSQIWVDRGAAGCWSVELFDDAGTGEPDRVRIAPVAATDVLSEVLAGVRALDT